MSEVRPDNLFVLVIIPDPQKSQAIADALMKHGVEKVQQTQHFRNIRKIIGTVPFDLVILGDGFLDAEPLESLTFLKHLPDTKELPLLWMTSSKDTDLRTKMREGGVSEILDDPLVPTQIQESLRNFFKRAQSREIGKLIQKASFFQEFSPEDVRALSKLATPRRFQVGETIISKGDPANRFYILLRGKVEVLNFPDNQHPYSILITEGSPFGELAVLDQAPRSAFCIAADDCLVLEIGSDLLTNPQSELRTKIVAQLAFSLAKSLRRMNEIVEEVQADYQDLLDRGQPPVLGSKEFTSSLTEQVAQPVDPISPPPIDEDLEEEEPQQARATADIIDERISTQEEYDVLHRKISLRSDFILGKIPLTLQEMVVNKLYGYLTGSKLAKMNLHNIWPEKSFTPGTPRLKRGLHLVVCCPEGMEAYEEVFLNLPFSHRVVGLSQTGCVGTFLGSPEAIDRYLDNRCLELAISQDLEMPIDRLKKGKDCIEFITHTEADVRPETLFLVFEREDGQVTGRLREAFPSHQIITAVKYFGFDPDEPGTLFSTPEQHLHNAGLLVDKKYFRGKGFYQGETFFLPDLSLFFKSVPALGEWGTLFGLIGILSKMGPDYSGITWGSRGGADGALKASRAMFGLKGPQNPKDLADAVNWADQQSQ